MSNFAVLFFASCTVNHPVKYLKVFVSSWSMEMNQVCVRLRYEKDFSSFPFALDAGSALATRQRCVVTNRGISLPRELQNYPGIGKNTFPGLFLEVAFVGLK